MKPRKWPKWPKVPLKDACIIVIILLNFAKDFGIELRLDMKSLNRPGPLF